MNFKFYFPLKLVLLLFLLIYCSCYWWKIRMLLGIRWSLYMYMYMFNILIPKVQFKHRYWQTCLQLYNFWRYQCMVWNLPKLFLWYQSYSHKEKELDIGETVGYLSQRQKSYRVPAGLTSSGGKHCSSLSPSTIQIFPCVNFILQFEQILN